MLALSFPLDIADDCSSLHRLLNSLETVLNNDEEFSHALGTNWDLDDDVLAKVGRIIGTRYGEVIFVE